MALFDAWLMVDWSASSVPKRGRDSIWWALAEREGGEVQVTRCENPSTRAVAIERIAAILEEAGEGRRILVGADFPFGYAAGTAHAIAGSHDWRSLWARFHERIEDAPGNANNRLDVAAELNAAWDGNGPFWGTPDGKPRRNLPARKPHGYGWRYPAWRRAAERRLTTTKTAWQLCGAGSVGGQALVGIAALEGLRRRFRDRLQVWPLETGFAPPSAPIALAEIYPSMMTVSPAPRQTKDEAQVRTLALHYAGLDAEGLLESAMRGPDDLPETERAGVLREEGWVLAQERAPAHRAPAFPTYDYLRDGAAIYERSFSAIEAEADLSRLSGPMRAVAARVVHACGEPEVARDLVHSRLGVDAGVHALQAGAPIICDARMVRHGVTERLLPADNALLCALDAAPAATAGTARNTRSALGIEALADRLRGAVVAVGNAPTALFRLLELVRDGAGLPALVLGFPVGFVGAAESKAALIDNPFGLEFIALKGRRGGSAMAAAAVNALAIEAGR